MSDLPVYSLEGAAPHLRRPFAPEAIKFRPVGGGRVVAYVDARVVIERLNAVIPGKWETRFEPFPGGKQIICHLTIDGICRSDVGTQAIGDRVDPVKAGYSDALKRAAVHFGVAVSIYALRGVWVNDMPEGSTREVGKQKKTTVLTDKGETWLRQGYRKWLGGPGKHFGEVLDHGDIEGSVGDPDASPDSPVQGDSVTAPSPELLEAREKAEATYGSLTTAQRKGLSKAKFAQQLRAAEDSELKLHKLIGDLERRAK